MMALRYLALLWLFLWAGMEILILPLIGWAFIFSISQMFSFLSLATAVQTRKMFFILGLIPVSFLILGLLLTEEKSRFMYYIMQWGVVLFIGSMCQFKEKRVRFFDKYDFCYAGLPMSLSFSSFCLNTLISNDVG